MLRNVILVCVAGLFLNFTGCSGGKGDAEMKEYIAAIKELKEAGGDQKKAEAAGKKMIEAGTKLEALKLTDDEKKKLIEKYKSDLPGEFKLK